MSEVRILLVDDHPVVREGLVAVLARGDDFHVVGEAADGRAALDAAARLRPHVAMVDVRLPDMTGIEVCERILQSDASVRVILMSAMSDERTVTSGFSAGASGFLLKSTEPSVIRDAVRMVVSGGIFLDPDLASRKDAFRGNRKIAKGPFGLTPQEMRVLEHVPLGLTNKGIGNALNISEDTVKTHIRRILFKLKAHDRAEAVAIALREGVL